MIVPGPAGFRAMSTTFSTPRTGRLPTKRRAHRIRDGVRGFWRQCDPRPASWDASSLNRYAAPYARRV